MSKIGKALLRALDHPESWTRDSERVITHGPSNTSWLTKPNGDIRLWRAPVDSYQRVEIDCLDWWEQYIARWKIWRMKHLRPKSPSETAVEDATDALLMGRLVDRKPEKQDFVTITPTFHAPTLDELKKVQLEMERIRHEAEAHYRNSR